MLGMCLVTGAAGGIGKAFCPASGGGRISGSSAPNLRLETAERALDGVSGEHRAIALDVADKTSVVKVFADAEATGAPIDQVVAAAGILIFAPNGERPITDIARQTSGR